MSPELADEVEAINAIYGDGSLVPADGDGKGEDADADADADGSEKDYAAGAATTTINTTTYILTLPDGTLSLRLRFPADYPAGAPRVTGTASSSSGARRGATARGLAEFRRALADAHAQAPGHVCLFDAIEQVQALGGAETRTSDAAPAHLPQSLTPAPAPAPAPEPEPEPEPVWHVSDPITELKSTFVGRCAAVASPQQAAQHVHHLLASDRRVRSAAHNITAWRIRGPNGTSFQDCDDDGETAAGGRLLHLMQLMDLWDAMVVVTRWYGGQKLGPRRFALINAAARHAFVKAALVNDPHPRAARKRERGGGGGGLGK